MKAAVAGAGYVGLSIAVLLSQKHNVVLMDIDEVRVSKINHHISPIRDAKIEEYLQKPLSLIAASDTTNLYEHADVVVIATPTNYDPEKNYFDTSSVKSVISQAACRNPGALIVVKSTVPVGFTRAMNEKYRTEKIVFCPEFLREGHTLEDNLYPSRIIIGADHGSVLAKAEMFRDALIECAMKQDIPAITMNSTEAVKFFAAQYINL